MLSKDLLHHQRCRLPPLSFRSKSLHLFSPRFRNPHPSFHSLRLTSSPRTSPLLNNHNNNNNNNTLRLPNLNNRHTLPPNLLPSILFTSFNRFLGRRYQNHSLRRSFLTLARNSSSFSHVRTRSSSLHGRLRLGTTYSFLPPTFLGSHPFCGTHSLLPNPSPSPRRLSLPNSRSSPHLPIRTNPNSTSSFLHFIRNDP